jgi:hypothetical protein
VHVKAFGEGKSFSRNEGVAYTSTQGAAGAAGTEWGVVRGGERDCQLDDFFDYRSHPIVMLFACFADVIVREQGSEGLWHEIDYGGPGGVEVLFKKDYLLLEWELGVDHGWEAVIID